MKDPIHIISLGAGVQSSTMALMAAEKIISPMPAFAVFADTGDEPDEVYSWLDTLRGLLPFAVKIAHRDPLQGKLSDNLFQWDHSQIPAFKLNQDGTVGIGKRQCTNHWKIVPIHKKIREETETQRQRLPPGCVSLWQGISTDEISRAKDSRDAWITHRFPLIERNMSRSDCKRWLLARGLKAPKSACFFCPYRSDTQWRKSKQNHDEWRRLLSIEQRLNERGEFLHHSCVTLGEVDFSTEEERGQLNFFNNECEGMCGV